MADENISNLLLSSIERYDQVLRWSLILTAILFIFHVTTFEPYTSTVTESARVKTELSIFDKWNKQLTSLRKQVDKVTSDTHTEIKSEFANLKRGFAHLNLETRTAWCNAQHQFSFEDLERCIQPATKHFRQLFPNDNYYPDNQNIQQMTQVLPVDQVLENGIYQEEKENYLTSELRDQIASMPYPGNELIEILEPAIEEKLLAPLFENLNQYWREHTEKSVVPILNKAFAIIDDINTPDIRLTKSIAETKALIEDAKETISSFAFEPPQYKDWWMTTGGKDIAGDQLLESVNAEYLSRSVLSSQFDTLISQLSVISSGKQGVYKQLEQNIKQLRDSFEMQQEELSKIIAPFQMVGIDLYNFCSHFPIIIGLAGATLLLWPWHRRRVVVLTAELARDETGEHPVWIWFLRRNKLSLFSFEAKPVPYLLSGLFLVWSGYCALRFVEHMPVVLESWLTFLLSAVILFAGLLIVTGRLSKRY